MAASPLRCKDPAAGDDPGVLRIDFPGYTSEESLRQISWEQFFDKFEKGRLAFLYQEETKEDAEQTRRARTGQGH